MRKINKKLCDIFRSRKPAPAPDKPKHEVPPVEGATFNLCLTNLLNDRKQPVWTHGNLVAVPWTRVLESPHFDLVRDRARAIYNSLDGSGSIVPLVTLHDGAVRLEFESEGVLAVYLLYPAQTLFGLGKRGEPYPMVVADAGPGVTA